MPRILVLQCKQEISSFNPVQTEISDYSIFTGEAVAARGGNTEMSGVLEILDARPDIEIIPTIAARAGSGGIISAAAWQSLSTQILDAVGARIDEADGIVAVLHGAMGAVGELDPEGFLLTELRRRARPGTPIVITLDLHGILTDRMLRQVDGVAVYHTYPHVDFADTGHRAARLLLRILDGEVKPVLARVTIPALVRGDELITETGLYGGLIRQCQALEADGTALAAAIMIGNPFTDVPELCSQVIVTTDGDAARAGQEAIRLANAFWAERAKMQADLIDLPSAIAQAKHATGTVIFTDAADATSSGASGDSVEIIRALRDAGYEGRVLAPVVDAEAAAAAAAAGVGATIRITLGGRRDARFTPMDVEARVEKLFDGTIKLETWASHYRAGQCALLTFGTFSIVVISRPMALVDRSVFYAAGLDPQDFDLVVVKSPHTEHHMFTAWSQRTFNIDAAGSTSANLPTLGHTICARPIYPLDPVESFTPSAVLYPPA